MPTSQPPYGPKARPASNRARFIMTHNELLFALIAHNPPTIIPEPLSRRKHSRPGSGSKTLLARLAASELLVIVLRGLVPASNCV